MLFLSNNRLKDWSEVERLAGMDQLEDLLLVGNPLYNEARDSNATAEYRVEVRGSVWLRTTGRRGRKWLG